MLIYWLLISEITCLLWSRKVHYRVYKTEPVNPVPCWLNPRHTLHIPFLWDQCIVLIIKPTRCTNFSIYFWIKLHFSDSYSVHHEELKFQYDIPLPVNVQRCRREHVVQAGDESSLGGGGSMWHRQEKRVSGMETLKEESICWARHIWKNSIKILNEREPNSLFSLSHIHARTHTR